MSTIRGLFLACLAVCVSSVNAGDPLPVEAEAPTVDIMVEPNLHRLGPEFEGWGTALAWFANVTGAWPDAERERLADLFYGEDGLRCGGALVVG